MPDFVKSIIFRIVVKYIEGNINQGIVEEYQLKALQWARAQIAKTPTTVDDRVLEVVLGFLTPDVVRQVQQKVLEFLGGLAASTPTEFDDQLIAAIKKALGFAGPAPKIATKPEPEAPAVVEASVEAAPKAKAKSTKSEV